MAGPGEVRSRLFCLLWVPVSWKRDVSLTSKLRGAHLKISSDILLQVIVLISSLVVFDPLFC